MDPKPESLLLHLCCAPCGGVPVRRLREEGFALTGLWHNPNIHPLEEWTRRKAGVEALSMDASLPMIWSDAFDQTHWQTRWHVSDRSRCLWCYDCRMDFAAQTAAEQGIAAFTTSLLISPYQNHEAIREAGERAAARHGVAFLYRDFRPDYREGQNLARAKGWYMQKYCGCVHSWSESDHPKKPAYDFSMPTQG